MQPKDCQRTYRGAGQRTPQLGRPFDLPPTPTYPRTVARARFFGPTSPCKRGEKKKKKVFCVCMRENMLITHLRGCTALFFLLWLPAIIFFFFFFWRDCGAEVGLLGESASALSRVHGKSCCFGFNVQSERLVFFFAFCFSLVGYFSVGSSSSACCILLYNKRNLLIASGCAGHFWTPCRISEYYIDAAQSVYVYQSEKKRMRKKQTFISLTFCCCFGYAMAKHLPTFKL